MAEENPYQPPHEVARSIEPVPGAPDLASRVSRLAASIIDSLSFMLVMLPSTLMASGFDLWERENVSLFHDVILTLVRLIVFVAIHGYLLITRGQTVGKLLLGIQIIDIDTGRVPPASRVLGIRYVGNGLLCQFPYFGPFYSIVDCLFIFRADKRCIHDVLANTHVVNVIR